MRFLITGHAGFIGYHLARRLLGDGHVVTGIDNFSDYYDVGLKQARTARLQTSPNFHHNIGDISDRPALRDVMNRAEPEIIIHLAAQAGVRYSLENPDSYIHSNIIGTHNLLALCSERPPLHLMLASTSSIYGGNLSVPFAETDGAAQPLSVYAATKGSTELLAHSYSHLYKIPTTMLRFFTVYGPWGRPDMALFKFTRAMLRGDVIDIYNHGKMVRDFTFIDDLIEGLTRLTSAVPSHGEDAPQYQNDSLSRQAPYRIVNIGGGQPRPLMDYIAALETALGVEAKKNFTDMVKGDVLLTHASSELLHQLIGDMPFTDIGTGISKFTDWYKKYYNAD